MFSKPAFHGELPESKSSCVLQDLHVDFFFAEFLQNNFISNGAQSCL